MSSGAASAGRLVAGRRAIWLPLSSTVMAARVLRVLRTFGAAPPVPGAAVPVFSWHSARFVCAPERRRFAEPLAARAAAHVGIDVNDTRRAAAGLLQRSGAAYPMPADPRVAVQVRYRIAGISTTAAVDRQGPTVARLPDAQTAAPLRRVLGQVTVR